MDIEKAFPEATGSFLLALEARKKLIENLLRQEKSINKVLNDVARDVAKEIRSRYKDGDASKYLSNIDSHLKNKAEQINSKLTEEFDKGIKFSVEAGLHQSKETTLSYFKKSKIDWKPIERTFFRENIAAVEDMKSRTIKGLNLSDRIWDKSKKARDSMGMIIEDAIKEGENPLDIADMLETYVRKGANTFAVDYPNMMERLGHNLPMDLNYESLRLARTETAAAFGNAAIKGASINPGSKGIQWRISNAGVTCDICLDYSNHNSGLGKGVYTVGDLPEYPAHPNCLCVLIEVMEDTGDFVDRLTEWNKNPMSQPDIEKWYQNVYKQGGVA